MYWFVLRVNGPVLTSGRSWVQTDMGNRGAVSFGFDKAETTIEDSVAGIVKTVGCLVNSLDSHPGF